MSLDPKESGILLQKLIKAGVKTPLCFEGGRGIGKSAIVKAVGNEINWHVIDIRLALDTPEDVAGWPRPMEDSVKYLVNDWFKLGTDMAKKKDGVIFFFDEINRAPLEVRQALFEIMTEYSVRRNKLPENSYIIFAMNPDNGQYQVEPLDPAFQRRMIRVIVKPSVKAWLKWGKENLGQEVTSFIENNPNYLFTEEKVEVKAEYNPDAWRMVNELNKAELTNDELTNCLMGLVGSAATALYIKYCKEKIHPILPKELFKMDKEAIIEYVKSSTKESMATITTVSDNLVEYTNTMYEKEKGTNQFDLEELEKFLTFMSALPPEIGATFMSKLEDKVSDHFINEKNAVIVALRRKIAKNVQNGTIPAELLDDVKETA